MPDKRTHILDPVVSKAGAFIEMDRSGWPEALKYPADQIVVSDDLSNYLNKTTDLVSQLEAETGTSNTPKSWSSLRVRQAIEAWWATIVATKDLTFTQFSNQNADFVTTILGNSKLEGIDFKYKSGTPVIKVGITAGGEEILFEDTIPSTGRLNAVQYMFDTNTFVYVSISGGVVDVMFSYRKNYWS